MKRTNKNAKKKKKNIDKKKTEENNKRNPGGELTKENWPKIKKKRNMELFR